MRWKKILRNFLVAVSLLIGLLLVFVLVSVAPVDRTPAKEFPSYTLTMNRLDSVKGASHLKPSRGIKVGYARVNLTPAKRTATAGYSKRRGKLFTAVHDSIHVNALVFDNGSERVAVVSADLLIIPPAVTQLLEVKLKNIGFSPDNTYLGATHTHNSIGHWGKGATGFLYGAYDESLVNFIADKIVACIERASANLLAGTIRTGVTPVPHAVSNRLIDGGSEDPNMRAIEIQRSDSSKLLLLSFTAHATCLYSRDLELSRDYPGVLTDRLETQGYDFVMFMAGAVGSHKCSPPAMGWDCTEWMAEALSQAFLNDRHRLDPVADSTIFMMRVPLALSDPQVKITPKWKIRSWLFRLAFGEYPVHINALRVGDVVMLGTPCDFSGEFDPVLDSAAKAQNLRAMVTSFNGGYIGYITPERYYDVEHYETQLMNWYAPGTGEYMEECLKNLMEACKE